MKRIFLLVCLGFPMVSWAQKDTVFYNERTEIIASRKNASSYSVDYPDTTDKNRVISKTFSIAGEIWSEGSFLLLDDSKKVRDGLLRTWYKKNGKLKSEINYKKDKLDGSVLTYWSNGQLRRNDIFENDKFLSGKCYTKQGQDTVHYDYYTKPSYQGGQEKLYEYLKENLQYPVQAKKDEKEGTVIVRFFVEKNGTVSEVTALKSSGNYQLDAEAVRVVSNMNKWNPAKIEGDIARTPYKLPVKFFLKKSENDF